VGPSLALLSTDRELQRYEPRRAATQRTGRDRCSPDTRSDREGAPRSAALHLGADKTAMHMAPAQREPCASPPQPRTIEGRKKRRPAPKRLDYASAQQRGSSLLSGPSSQTPGQHPRRKLLIPCTSELPREYPDGLFDDEVVVKKEVHADSARYDSASCSEHDGLDQSACLTRSNACD
jgi:hypothetical protein